MEQSVEAVYHKEILTDFLIAYGLETEYKLLGDFENYVYEVRKENQSYILRITHSSHRSEAEINGELNWLSHLHRNGANVPTIFPSNDGNLVERKFADDQSVFYACLFSRVPGDRVRGTDSLFNEALFYSWGKEIGKIHRLTSGYHLKQGIRKQWYEDDLLDIEKYVPDEEIVILRTKEIMEELHSLPKDQHYGLIHNDVHNGNFFYDGIKISIFDFDDACYFWYVSDIAIPLYYSCHSLFTNETSHTKRAQIAKGFLTSFMKGYREEIEPPNNWMQLLPLFLRVRDITLYAALNKKIAVEQRDKRIKHWMRQLKQRIEDRTPIVSNFGGEEVV